MVDAVAVGHYLGVKPQAAEKGLDDAISGLTRSGSAALLEQCVSEEGLLTQFTLRGTINGDLGQPFLLPDPRDPARVIAVAGMGVPGRFGIGEMTVVARELCWTVGRLGCKHLATVLIGAGNGNLTAEQSVDAWLRGLAQTLSSPSTEPPAADHLHRGRPAAAGTDRRCTGRQYGSDASGEADRRSVRGGIGGAPRDLATSGIEA